MRTIVDSSDGDLARAVAARDLVQQVMLLTIEKLRGGSVRDPDQIASFVLGMSRTMARDLKRLEWRREKRREAFMVPDMVEAPAGDATLDVDRLETVPLPSMRLQLTLASAGATRAELGRYVLDHRASTPPA